MSLQLTTRRISMALAGVMAAAALLLGAPAARAESGKEKTARIATYALGAGTVYALSKKKGTLALLGAAGTYLAYKTWKGETNKRDDRRRNNRYQSRRVVRRYR